MSGTGLAIIYIIIWWIVFFAILPIDVNRNKIVKIEGEDPGSPENPRMLKNLYMDWKMRLKKSQEPLNLGVNNKNII